MSLLRRRAVWNLVYTNQRVAEDIRVISSDMDSLGRDVEWNAIHRLNVLLLLKLDRKNLKHCSHTPSFRSPSWGSPLRIATHG